MLSKCANSECNAPFHYLREGKLFQIDSRSFRGPQLVTEKKNQRVEYFWLCGACAEVMTLTFDRSKGVVAVPQSPSHTAWQHKAAGA